MAELAEEATTTAKTERSTRRLRLVFAVAGFGQWATFMLAGYAVYPLTGGWTPLALAIMDTASLAYAAFVAWLAFAVFDTDDTISVLPRRWRELGLLFAAWCVGQEILTAANVWLAPAEHLAAAEWRMQAYIQFGDLRFGWLVVSMLALATAEEIVYRALLLRALEGFMTPARALFVHAVIFEIVHALVYGGLRGVWFIGGLVLGHAFQRTRSLAVPTLLHAAHNTLFFALVWYFNQ
ncbi:MAG: type II CAAX endopeptidase family protein [Enhygromyxa sp.]